MKDFVKKFDIFVNEDLNYEFSSDDECYLTRKWYYYNIEDDIVYGSDEKPYEESPLIFGNNIDNFVLISLNIDTFEVNEYYGEEEIIEFLNKNSLYDVDIKSKHNDDLQNFFETFDDTRFILLDKNRIIAITIDIIEEN